MLYFSSFEKEKYHKANLIFCYLKLLYLGKFYNFFLIQMMEILNNNNLHVM